MIADAFVDHPYFMRAFPRKDVRLDACRALYTAALMDGMQHGIVDVASQDRIIGVMISFAPGHYPPTLGACWLNGASTSAWRPSARLA